MAPYVLWIDEIDKAFGKVIVDAMHQAVSTRIKGQRRDFNTEDILQAVAQTVPLAAIAAHTLAFLHPA
ncbi:hypothetical protein [Nostoc sp. LPT]|uniref:hypothetical protein n=1 Tax=Nostoc sp. LPT TaxID=2815387 RepID=UPI0025FDDC40|nr:hypothetical protein [Nostoc sp. LPT]